MKDDSKIWVYPQSAQLVAGRYEMPGSRGTDRVVIMLDRDLTPSISPDDPRTDLQAMRRQLEEAAQRLFDEGFVTKVEDQRAPQFFHWQIVITKADLDESPTS